MVIIDDDDDYDDYPDAGDENMIAETQFIKNNPPWNISPNQAISAWYMILYWSISLVYDVSSYLFCNICVCMIDYVWIYHDNKVDESMIPSF